MDGFSKPWPPWRSDLFGHRNEQILMRIQD
jgi:hypothetical protein